MKKLPLQSANFKRDYVAMSAIVLFVLIVISEVALAIAIPTYLFRENAMALQVRRLKLLESFDGARFRCTRIKPKNLAAEMELQLISWDLDRLAVYMRNESKHLTGDEIARIQDAVTKAHVVLTVIEKGGSLSQEAELNTEIYINSLLPKEPPKTKKSSAKKDSAAVKKPVTSNAPAAKKAPAAPQKSPKQKNGEK